MTRQLVTCHCEFLSPCPAPATQEDFLCDPCRTYRRGETNMHMALPDWSDLDKVLGHTSAKVPMTSIPFKPRSLRVISG